MLYQKSIHFWYSYYLYQKLIDFWYSIPGGGGGGHSGTEGAAP